MYEVVVTTSTMNLSAPSIAIYFILREVDKVSMNIAMDITGAVEQVRQAW